VNRHIPKFDITAAHLNSIGIRWEPFYGFDNRLFRLTPVDTFDVDRAGERIGTTHVAACMSHYMLWKVMMYLPEDIFWVLEFDAEFVPGWREQWEAAMRVLPADWDIVFIGSCCTGGKDRKHVGGNLYEVRHPLCGHAMMYRKKALPVLLDTHQRVWAPLDIAMAAESLPKLRVYTILPRIVNQIQTYIPD
jgi:GR25 family glycosyltransferase involved in LPS biosynthesis